VLLAGVPIAYDMLKFEATSQARAPAQAQARAKEEPPVKPLNSKLISITPDANLSSQQQLKGSVVVCKGGAMAGARIHFDAPSIDKHRRQR